MDNHEQETLLDTGGLNPEALTAFLALIQVRHNTSFYPNPALGERKPIGTGIQLESKKTQLKGHRKGSNLMKGIAEQH